MGRVAFSIEGLGSGGGGCVEQAIDTGSSNRNRIDFIVKFEDIFSDWSSVFIRIYNEIEQISSLYPLAIYIRSS